MNGRALRTACALTLLVLLGGAVTAVSVADNPHGTPPGQVGKSDNGNGNGNDSPAASQSSQASTDASSNLCRRSRTICGGSSRFTKLYPDGRVRPSA